MTSIINKNLKATIEEQAAIDAVVVALKALPKSIVISIDDDDGHFHFDKRAPTGSFFSAQTVFTLRRRALFL